MGADHKTLYEDISERFRNGGAHVLLLKMEDGFVFYDTEAQENDRPKDFQGMCWDPDALDGLGAYWATWIDDGGERHWIATSGSLDRDLSELEARLRLGGLLAEEHGVRPILDMERHFSGVKEGIVEKTVEESKRLRFGIDDALLEWVQSKNALEGRNHAWPGQIADVPRDIDTAADVIQANVRAMSQEMLGAKDRQDIGLDMSEAMHAWSQNIHAASVQMSAAVKVGTDHTVERARHGAVFDAWQASVGAVEAFADGHKQIAQDLPKGIADYDLGYAVGSLETAAGIAREQRLRGIRLSLDGPLAEYALEDAQRIGALREPAEKEAGVLRGRLPGVAVLEQEGTFVACPVPPGQYTEVGKRITLHDQGDGTYRHYAPRRSVQQDMAVTEVGKAPPRVDQERVLSGTHRPGVVTRWTGRVLGQEPDGSALYVQAAGKVTRLTLDEPDRRFPPIAPGSYGAFRVDSDGVVFAPKSLQRDKGLQRG